MDTNPFGSIFVRKESAIASIISVTVQNNATFRTQNAGSTGSRARGMPLTRMCVVPNFSFRVRLSVTSRELELFLRLLHMINSFKMKSSLDYLLFGLKLFPFVGRGKANIEEDNLLVACSFICLWLLEVKFN